MADPSDFTGSLPRLWLFCLLVTVGLGAACGSTDRDAWGSEAIRYFDGVSAALTADDTYGVLDFYALDARIESRTGDFQDRSVPVSEYLASHRADLKQNLIDVHLGATGAVTLVEWPGAGRLGAVLTEVSGNSITSEIQFVDVDSLSRSLLASPDVVERYVGLYRTFLARWSSGSGDAARLYASDATVRDALTGHVTSGVADIEQLFVGAPATPFEPVAMADLIDTAGGPVAGLALFLDPVSFGRDPGRAIGVVTIGAEDCPVQMAVVWDVRDGQIQAETRYPEIVSLRTCTTSDVPDGWWSGLALPGPRDAVVTGVIETDTGQKIPVHNGTARLEDLVRWGLGRFATAGLGEPLLNSVTFEPTRRCEGVGGRVVAGDGSHDLTLCIDERSLCPEVGGCASPVLAVRAAMLHELGHAWLNDHATEEKRKQLMDVSGRTVWSDPGVAWVDRVVEYAAEVLAWGLVDAPIALEQLGNPPCDELGKAFSIMTGRAAVARGDASC